MLLIVKALIYENTLCLRKKRVVELFAITSSNGIENSFTVGNSSKLPIKGI